MARDDEDDRPQPSPEVMARVRAAVEMRMQQPLADDWLVRTLMQGAEEALIRPAVFDHSHEALREEVASLRWVVETFDRQTFGGVESRADLRTLLVSAIQAAFLIGGHAQGTELAKVLESRRQAAGGKKGAETRRARADAGWKAHATDLIRAVRAEHPTLSRDGVAARVSKRWEFVAAACPSARTLTEHLRSLEESGLVPPRQK